MQGIELKEFQINCVNKLLDATTVGSKKEVLVQAPTGSGKTIILLDYIEEYIEENKNTIFVQSSQPVANRTGDIWVTTVS